MNVVYYYQGKPNKEYEVIITSFSNLLSQVLDLPDTLEVCLYPLPPNVHGGIDTVRVNRIAMNINLLPSDIPKILTHELIHVSQKHTGLLTVVKGICHWRGIPYTNKKPEELTYEEYENLPWEVDVRNRQESVLKQALQIYNNS